MNQIVKGLLAAVMGIASLLSAGAALAEGATNARERFFLKRQNCHWSGEMGRYIYECIKANHGFNAHWCHNEALDVFCAPDDANAAPAAKEEAKQLADSGQSGPDNEEAKKRAARQGEENLRGTIERERTMLKYKDCKWTDEMGKFVYECVKRNNGFGTHWCYDEALQTMCPQPAPEPKT